MNVYDFHLCTFERVEIRIFTWNQYIADPQWNFFGSSISQILREIKTGESSVAKPAILILLEALNFDFYALLHFLKAYIYKINIIQCPKNGKNGSYRISRMCMIDFT